MNIFSEKNIHETLKKNFLNYFDLFDKINDNVINEYTFENDNFLRVEELWDSVYNLRNESEELNKNIDIVKNEFNIEDVKLILIQKIFNDNNTNSYSNNYIDNILISAYYNKYIYKNFYINDENDYIQALFLALCNELIYNNKINTNSIYLTDIQPNIITNNNIKDKFKSFVNFLSLNNLINYNILFWVFIILNEDIYGLKEDLFIGYLFDISDKLKIDYCKKIIYSIDIRNETIINKLKNSLNDESINLDNHIFLRRKDFNYGDILNRFFTQDMFYLMLKYPPTKSINLMILNDIYKKFNKFETDNLCKIYNTLNILNTYEVLNLYINKKRCIHYIYLINNENFFDNEYYIKYIPIERYIYPKNVKNQILNILDEKLKMYFDDSKSFNDNLKYIKDIKMHLKNIFLEYYPNKIIYLKDTEYLTNDLNPICDNQIIL